MALMLPSNYLWILVLNTGPITFKTMFHLNTILFIFFHSLIQFFLRLGCKKKTPNLSTFPVYLQYSNNGGVSWTTIEQFDFSKYSNKPTYIALHLPENARTNSTRIRWWQPSVDGTFLEDWAIDHVCWIQRNPLILNSDYSFSWLSQSEMRSICNSDRLWLLWITWKLG